MKIVCKALCVWISIAVLALAEISGTTLVDENYYGKTSDRDYQEAIARYTQAIKLDPNDAKAYFWRGLSSERQGNYLEAIADLDEAIRLDPNDASAYDVRGLAYADLGNYSKAIADYSQTIKLDPRFASAYRNRGIAYANLGDYENAISDLNLGIDRDRSDARTAFNARASFYLFREDYKKATADARIACYEFNDCHFFNLMRKRGQIRD